jgi:hypothetical protein
MDVSWASDVLQDPRIHARLFASPDSWQSSFKVGGTPVIVIDSPFSLCRSSVAPASGDLHQPSA